MSVALRTLSILASLTLLGACSGSVAPSGDDDMTPKLGSPNDGGSTDWTLIQPCSADAPDDSIAIESVEISGDTLTVRAGHSAGCEKHTYGLCYENEWAESEPVQIGLRLLHDAHGETCEAYKMLDLNFDLTPLQEAYNEAYRSDGGTISLSLPGQSFLYVFGPPTWEQVEAEIDALNSCEVVADCRSIATMPCETAYVNASADTTALEAMIAEYNYAEWGDSDILCAADCACGILTCESGKCTTAAGTCDPSLPEDAVTICL